MEIDKYLNKETWTVKENSNINYSAQALNLYLAGKEVKKYWMSLYGKEVENAHDDGYFHIHDLTSLTAYCCGYNMEEFLYNGFGIKGQSTSKPPKHLSSALGQLVNFLCSASMEIAGAVAVSSFDTLLSPFVKEDNLTYDQVKQLVQEFIFSINVPTRVGGQRVFSNITLDLNPPNKYKTKKVVIGGQKKDYCYGDCQKEMNMINKALAEVMTDGDSSGRVFSFPIITVNLTNDFDWTNFDELWELTGKYGAYTFANYINSDMNPEDSRSLCCRLRLNTDELPVRRGGLFGIDASTGSIGVVTLSLPMIAMESEGNKEKFLSLLSYYANLAKSSLEIKRRVVEDLTEKGLYPYNKQIFSMVKEETGSYWANHFSTIGLIGANEACRNMFGKDITDEESKTWVKEVMQYLLEKTKQFNSETGHLYNLEATPGEGCCYSLAQKALKKYPACAVQSSGEDAYFTNSTHLPVDKTGDIFEILEHQEELQVMYTGGTTINFFLGQSIDGAQAKMLVKKIAETYKIPYFTLSPTFSVCNVDGFIEGEHEKCPKCGEQTEIYTRIVGYFSATNLWNKGKLEEFKNRSVWDTTK